MNVCINIRQSAHWQDTWLFAVSQQLYALSISHTDTSTSFSFLSTYVSTSIQALFLVEYLLSAAVVSGMLASLYFCLLSQHVVVYGHQNMSCSHQPHIPPGPPQF